MSYQLTIDQAGRRSDAEISRGVSSIDLSDFPATLLVATVDDSGARLELTAEPWSEDLQLSVTVPGSGTTPIAHWPSYQGVTHSYQSPAGISYEFRGPGWNSPEHDDRRLGIPLVILEREGRFHLIGTDPGYSADISMEDDGAVRIGWTYLAAAGRHDIVRRIVVAEAGSIEDALDAWFTLATPDIPRGPDWLHEIGWQHYDFMSHNGEGWFDDIDSMCEIVAPEDRGRVAFTLHAWYDTVGRYCFDPGTHQLDERWTVFPYINDPLLLAVEGVEQTGTQPRGYQFRNLRDYRPLEMDWDEVRRRILYAKDRGFRVPFYFITGMMDLGDAAGHAMVGDGLNAEGHTLWTGPEAIGANYLMNPLHPAVRERILGLTNALLERVGDLIDALVIDEAYFIGYGKLGPVAQPGYADLAQATLVQEIAALCHAHRPDIAVLTADHMGTQYLEGQAFPYCLFADGIYHDAWNHAQAHEAARFPAWRNTTWSCIWTPESEIANTKWAVLAYDAPISTSNGCFGDDIGIRDMSAENQELLRKLWASKTGSRRRRQLAGVFID